VPKKEVITEIEGRRIKLTNLQKVLYPNIGTMKAELISYYINIAPTMLKYISQRPMTLIRYPDGVEASRFYSKNKPNWTPSWVASVKIDPEDEKTYIMVNEIAALAWTANLASLELHPMQIKANNLSHPDHIIFDLDPPETADFEVVKQLALNLKPFLESYGYHPFIKTSGSKGLHIYVPIQAKYDYPFFTETIKTLAKEYVKQDPVTTLKMNKEKRKGRVLLDIYRNHKSQTCVAPYSTRGKAGAPVSAPIFWEELKEMKSSQAYNITSIQEKLKVDGDPWESFYDHAVNLHVDNKSTQNDDALLTYDKKRDFKKTKEPIAQIEENAPNNRYVIQLHDASNLHYDLRIEDEGVLKSWAIPKGLPLKKGYKRLAIETEPHPIKYLTFEGKIPKQEYGGGEMWIFDSGEYEYIKKEDKKIKIRLKNGAMQGVYTLINTKGQQWLVDTEIEETQMGAICKLPMLASMGDKIPPASKYSYEIKWDGIRVLIQKKGKYVTIRSRKGKDLTAKFPLIVQSFLEKEPEHIIADGEIVALNENGTPNFGKTVGRMHLNGKDAISRAAKKTKTVTYLFDCLFLDGRDIRKLPLEKRREWLRVNIKVDEYVRFSQSFDNGKQLFEAIKAQKMEGIMCKLKGSKYESDNRSKSWLKIKVSHNDTALIIGYTAGKGDRSSLFGSLHLAKQEGDKLVYYGKVGTGFNQAKIKEILKLLKEVPTTKKPIPDSIEEEQSTTWIAPSYQCDIKFASMTSNNTYREPVYLGMKKVD